MTEHPLLTRQVQRNVLPNPSLKRTVVGKSAPAAYLKREGSPMAAADLYILGTSHALQCGSKKCSPSSILAFDTELRGLCERFKIRRIAEEMNADGLTHHEITETVGQRMARELGIAHQTVDLSRKERVDLSIDDSVVLATSMRYGIANGGGFREAFDDLADGVRERVWLSRILANEEWPTLFVCGSDHAPSLRRLWRRLGLDAKVVHFDYEP